jgi:hypothetical protein
VSHGIDVEEALAELRQYLSDIMAPLVFADSLRFLITKPPLMVAEEIQSWTLDQFRRSGSAVPLSDFLYHAVRKLYLVGEYKLVAADALSHYLEVLKELVLRMCPPEDRELLRENLNRLSDSPLWLDAPVPALHRQDLHEPVLVAAAHGSAKHTGAPAGSALDEATANALRRFTLLAERLTHAMPPPALRSSPVTEVGQRPASTAEAGAPSSQPEVLSQLLVAAAQGASNLSEFQGYRQKLSSMGLDLTMEDVFRSIAHSLPQWNVTPSSDLAAALPAELESEATKAMERLVTLDQDDENSAQRFRELVESAITLCNEGSLPRAVTMLELAEKLIAEGKVDGVAVQSFRQIAHERLDPSVLRRFVEDDANRASLQRLLNFFPGLHPEALLAELQHEEDRERRHYLLALLASYGESVRPLMLELLTTSMSEFGGRDAYFQRNLLYLLRHTAKPGSPPLERELDAAIKLSEPGTPLLVVKEAVRLLGQIADERSERTLIERIEAFESMLSRPRSSPYDTKDLVSVVDRAVFALGKISRPQARRVVVEHGLRQNPRMGDTVSRLAALSGQDLSGDEELVARLLRGLEASLPFKLFGMLVKKAGRSPRSYIAALSSTPLPEVRKAFEEIVARYSGQDFAEMAEKALTTLAPGEHGVRPTAGISGDLEVFGLPSLLQNLAQSNASGTLTLTGSEGHAIGMLMLERGGLAACRVAHLSGNDAFYHLLERPSPGTFSFVSRPETQVPESSEPSVGLLPLLFEGMRRYDEYQQAAVIVPDEARMKPTGVLHTAPESEPDDAMLTAVWQLAVAGAPAINCGGGVPVDVFRVRRALAHWVMEGSLQIA